VTTGVPVALHWSGGKDSTLALARLREDGHHDVRCLVTTVEDGPAGVEASVHGVPVRLLRAQADAVGLPLDVVRVGAGLSGYGEAMAAAARRWVEAGVRAVAFGDLEHSGALPHRESLWGPLGLAVVEPLWGMSSRDCVDAFVATGASAVTVVVDADVLSRRHLGVPVDPDFLAGLPTGCDPCGEGGEYHSFVRDAPFFSAPVPLEAGAAELVTRRIGTTDGVREFRYWCLPLA
jgi:uncharacterized protein (TIGR00290 family)